MVKTYKSSQYLDGITIAVNFKNCIKQLKYYFTNIIKVKEKILAGKIIDTPYVIFQRDRRKRDIPVKKDRREVTLIGLN